MNAPDFLKDVRRITQARYAVDIPWNHLEHWISRQADIIDTSPDYQREHVWTKAQRIAWLEWVARGGRSGTDIYWNCPGWMGTFKGPLELVDGKQRVHSVRLFMADKLPIFGRTYSGWNGTLPMLDMSLRFHIADMDRRADVLQWYVDMNAGGTVHKKREIDKVREMIASAKKEDRA